MTIALVIVASLLGVAATASGLGKLTKKPAVIDQLTGLGVSASVIPVLGLIEIAGTVGLIVGIWVAPIGIAAAIGFVLYFLGAVLAHVRHHDKVKDLAPAAILFLVSIATMLLEFHR